MEGIFATPGGGSTLLGGSVASGHQHENVGSGSLPLPSSSAPSAVPLQPATATPPVPPQPSTAPPPVPPQPSTHPRPSSRSPRPNSLVSSLVHHVMNSGPCHVARIPPSGVLVGCAGTEGYTPPEVWRGFPYSAKADVWGLGATRHFVAQRWRPRPRLGFAAKLLNARSIDAHCRGLLVSAIVSGFIRTSIYRTTQNFF